MKRTLPLPLLCLAYCFASAQALAGDPPRFELVDGDRVVLLGGALIERDQSHGYLETLLTVRDPGRAITFRNLGWSGDTVWGEARAGFGKAADGFKHLEEHVLALKPTVIVLGYGGNEAFAGRAGLPRFLEGLDHLLDVLAPTGARVVVLSPPPQEDLGPPLPDPARHNDDLRLYRDALEEVAARRGHRFVDLFDSLGDPGLARPLTDDGLHLTDQGYRQAALAIASGLGLEPPSWGVAIGRDGRVESAFGTTVWGVRAREDGLRFEAQDAALPGLPRIAEAPSGAGSAGGPKRTLAARGLAPGRYVLKIDGAPVASADAGAWAAGVAIGRGPELEQAERLRQAVIRKNLLYFYRWRPQNETYLFGFRKNEQGNNAREIPLFDPLVAEQEARIAGLRVPVSHVYELTPESEVGR